ncbi:MAG TPA: sulfatase [Verrucomicrobiae bacterium]
MPRAAGFQPAVRDVRRSTAPKYTTLLLTLLWLASAITLFAASKPDIVVFLTDDQGQLDLQPYGDKNLRTPNMQKLADAGMLFTRAYVASPSCAPSRAALLTGLMPARNGSEANHSKPRAELKKWPAYFQELGYEVIAFGKISHYKHTVDYGFDYFAHDTFHDHASIPAAVEYLKNRPRENAKPLCLMVGSNWPHVPWPDDASAYDPAKLPLPAGSIDTPATREWRARYAAAVTKADADLGTIRTAVKTYLSQDALFFFSADHGAQWPFGKWNCYEAGVAVPLIVAWPDKIKPGSRTDAMVSWVDFLPTLVEAAGGKPAKDLDGRSFLKVLQGKAGSLRDKIFTTHTGDGQWNIYPIRSVRTEDGWKYIRNIHPEYAFTTHIDLAANQLNTAYFPTWEEAAKTNANAAAIVKRYHARPAEELYDLNKDPKEQVNLATDPKHAKRLKSLSTELDAWLKSQDDKFTVAGKPRPLSDPSTYGSKAQSGKAAPKDGGKQKAKKQE